MAGLAEDQSGAGYADTIVNFQDAVVLANEQLEARRLFGYVESAVLTLPCHPRVRLRRRRWLRVMGCSGSLRPR